MSSTVETRPARRENPSEGTARAHILYVVDELKVPFGGAERILFRMVQRLPADLFRCSVVTLSDSAAADLFPCPVHVFPMTSTYNLHGIRMAGRLAKLIRDEDVRIVQTFFESSDIWGGLVARLASSAKVISSRRDMGIFRTKKHDFAYHLLRRVPHKVLAVSEQVRQYVIAADGYRAEDVLTIHNGLNLTEFPNAQRGSIRARFGIAEGIPIVVTVGNLRRVKGFDTLLRVAVRARRQCDPFIVLILGGIPTYEDCSGELQALVRALKLQDCVRFAGEVTDVPEILQACDVFVLPSRSEGFSNALIEGMAAGLPCIATRVGGNAEAVLDGVTGFLVAAEDPDAIADRLCWLFQHPADGEEMGGLGRKRIEEQFSLEAMISKLTAVYLDLLKQ